MSFEHRDEDYAANYPFSPASEVRQLSQTAIVRYKIYSIRMSVKRLIQPLLKEPLWDSQL